MNNSDWQAKGQWRGGCECGGNPCSNAPVCRLCEGFVDSGMKSTPCSILVLLALALVLASQGRLAAQDATPPPSVYYAAPMQAWDTEVALGLRLLTVPREIAEEEINKAPSIEVLTVTGLPWQFAVRSGAVLQFVTNHFRLGAMWSFRLGDVSIGVGDDWAFWFGFIDIEGFDNRANGWVNYPGVSLGYDFGDVRLTVKGEGIFILSQHSLAGENEVSSTKRVLSGGVMTLVVEQPLTEAAHVFLGVRLALTKFHYQTWFAFSTFDRHLLFSELMFGVIL
jgi:hypothetical protein